MASKAFLKIKAGLMDALAYARRHTKYAYVVTTRVTGEPENVYAPPVLGLHSNYTKAAKHFDRLIKDRATRPEYMLHWNTCDAIQMGSHIEMRKARMKYRSFDAMATEEITIARWPM